MRATRWCGTVTAVLVGVAAAHAQPPAVPGAPPLPGGPVPTPVGAAPAVAPAAPAAAPRNIWGFFMKTPEQKAQCRAHFCNSRAGMFVNNLLVPAGLATGGLLGPVCPPPGAPGGPGGPGGPPSAADLAKPPGSPEGAAARIKAEEAQAKAKIAALEFLATVDCRYYPEAEAGLIAGLRAEKNECVRLAAAKALASGCCCSPKVVKALTITVTCSTADTFPAEASELVRTYAFVALERCLRKCVEEEPEVPPELPPAAKKAVYEALAPAGRADYSTHVLLASYYALQPGETPERVFDAARRALARGLHLSPRTLSRLSGPKNVRDAVFPPESRPALPLASFSMPSFAAAKLPSFRRPPEPQVQPQPVAMPAYPVEPARPAPTTRANAAAPTVAPPVPAPGGRTGRGNLLHIVQDAWKR